jgi:hypothetical protein
MKRFLCMIPLAMLVTTAFAQEQPLRVSDMLDLEEKIMMKKMTDDLNKPNPNMPPPMPVIVAPKEAPVVYPTETLAIYGTNATSYEGQLSLGGRIYTVRKGTPVQAYTVTAIGPDGIELTRYVPGKKHGKKHRSEPERQVTFVPLAAH